MKINRLILVLLSFNIFLLVNNCSETTQPEIHPVDWMDSSSDNFHGKQLLTEGLEGIEYCRTCHGENLNGGSADVSCSQCHEGGFSGHPGWGEWMNVNNPEHHGRFFYENGLEGVDYCRNCHGDDLTGGIAGYSCYQCHSGGPTGHPEDSLFLSISSPEFHGNGLTWDEDTVHCMNCHGENLDGGVAYFSCRGCHPESLPFHTHDPGFLDYDSPLFHASDYIWDNDTELCTGCHGDDLTGGISLTTCRTCHAEDLPYHAHGPSALDPFSTDYHGKLLWDNGWNFSACEACHGDDLNGGIVNIGCTTSCHQEQDGLGNCGNCHGDRISGDPAPPLGIMNSSDPGELSVGAHQEHLNSSIAVVSCSDCHLVPSDYMDSDHLGSDNRAEVVITEDFNYYQLTPEYDYSSGTCSNTYCHGGFSFPKESSSSQWVHTQDEIVGNNQPMVWNDVQDLTCTVCHGLPPAGHLDNGISCSVCHSSVVDDSLQIINTSLHINGEINQN